MRDPVPAVTEAGATGENAEIFADIRHVYRVGVVNLVWRHLATFPGALPWVWESVRPLYVDGTLEREAAVLRASIALPDPPVFPPAALAGVGLSERDLEQIRAVLAAYDRTNAMALIALSAVGGKLAAFRAPPIAWSSSAPTCRLHRHPISSCLRCSASRRCRPKPPIWS